MAEEKTYLRRYYENVYPYEEMVRWLSYGDAEYFKRREFSYTLQNEAYIRYKCYYTAQQLKSDLNRYFPIKFDVGCMYNITPDKRGDIQGFGPSEKELVFDVDMTDYDDVRTCCKEANICSTCWPLMNVAIKVLSTLLAEHFGFQSTTWFFSGRRGIHGWVSDARARTMTVEERMALLEYISVVIHRGVRPSAEMPRVLHPHLQSSYDEILLPFFEAHMIPEMDILANHDDKGWEAFLHFIPSLTDRRGKSLTQPIKEMMLEKWRKQTLWSGSDRWQHFKAQVEQMLTKHPACSTHPVYNAVFTYCYPRLDAEVSKQIHHLLKAPFCVHPKTGKICVPIPSHDPAAFDPFTSPTLTDVVERGTSLSAHIALLPLGEVTHG